MGSYSGKTCRRFKKTGQDRLGRMLYRWQLCSGQKGGCGVGKTKRGKGSKIMAIADSNGLPVAISTHGASPHEVNLVKETLSKGFTKAKPKRLIGDMAYDSDPLDRELKKLKIKMIAPHKSNRVKPATQDGRELRRYKRRWKVERLFAWIQQFRRCQTRFDYYGQNYLAFVQIACMVILLRNYF
jgi:transposase